MSLPTCPQVILLSQRHVDTLPKRVCDCYAQYISVDRLLSLAFSVPPDHHSSRAALLKVPF